MVAIRLLVLFHLLSVGSCLCPAGWAQRGDTCFFLFQDKMNRSEAAIMCGRHSAQLVTVTDNDKFIYLGALVTAAHLDTGAWTSYTIHGKRVRSRRELRVDSRLESEVERREMSSDDSDISLYDIDDMGESIVMTAKGVDLQSDKLSSLRHPFCERDIEARDVCDTNDNWSEILQSCYKMFPPATWSDAVTTCTNLGGEVLSPISVQEIVPATSLTDRNTSFWIGASYKIDSYYFAADNRPVDFLPWLTDNSNFSNPNKSCVAALNTGGVPDPVGYFMSACEEERTFICRRAVGTCPLGWFMDGSLCYKLHIRPEERLTWFLALDYCLSRNARMAQELSTQALMPLYKTLKDNDIPLSWLGLSGSGWPYKYIDGTTISRANVYAFDTTNVTGAPSRCGVTDFDPRRNGLFLASYCFSANPFVCTMGLSDVLRPAPVSNLSCQPNWVLFEEVCYKLVRTPATQPVARNICRTLNGTLAMVNDTVQQSFFSTSWFTRFGLETFWIGVWYNTSTSQYVLGDTGQQVHFWNFDPNQIMNSSFAPCVYLQTGANADFMGSWFAERCQASHSFVCQKEAQQDGLPQEMTQTVWRSECGVGWTYNNLTNLCYWVSPYVHRSWNQARDECQALQGDLLSVGGLEEQAAIEALLKTDTFNELEESLWIGAADQTDLYGWSWSNGRPFRFLHWAEGQPQYDSEDGDNCASIPVTKNYQWETRSCSTLLGYVCRKPAASTQTVSPPTEPSSLSCGNPVSLISGTHSIQFPQDFSASSFKDADHAPDRCRIIPSNQAAWSPAQDSPGEWLAVNFHSPVTITDIHLRGEDSSLKYVSKFKLQYQLQSDSLWYWYTDVTDAVKVFDGVPEMGGRASIHLFGQLRAHAIKIWPVGWGKGIAIQLELSGCPEEECVADYVMSGPMFVDERNIRASSEQPGFEAWNARIKPSRDHQRLTSWMPSNSDRSPWIEVDLGSQKIIQGVTLAGDQNYNFVTLFQLMLSQSPGEANFLYTEPYGTVRNFSAMTSYGQTVTVFLQSSVEARVVRLVPLLWQGSLALKFDVLVCSSGCTAQPLLAGLPDNQLSASSSDGRHPPSRSRLNTQTSGDNPDCWRPLNSTARDAAFIQVDLGTVMQVRAVATQGSASENFWVTSYYLAFSLDGRVFRRYGGNVTSYTIANRVSIYNDSVLYPGNFDGSTVVKNELAMPVNARYIQLWPHQFQAGIALRWEVFACSKHTANTPLGCYADDDSDPDLPFVPLDDPSVSIYPEVCLSYCYDKGFHFAGLKNGDFCSCGNSYGMYGEANSCNLPCRNPFVNFTCGGKSQNTVYSTGLGSNSLVCPPGWTEHGSSCYSLFDQDSWPNARDSCQKLGAGLADISDPVENQVVTSVVVGKAWRQFETDNVGPNAWIGLNDVRSNIQFEWSSGAEVNFTNWGYHQPSANPALRQQSVLISPDGSWMTSFSDDILSYVCETSKKPSTDPYSDTQDLGCPKQWKAGGLKCYMFYRQKKTWSDALQMCLSQNSSLARAESSNENMVLSAALSELDGNYWVDVRDSNNTGLYVHAAGSPYVIFAGWARQKPDTAGSCVSLMTARGAGAWVNQPCQTLNRFVCEQPRVGFFPPGNPVPNNISSCGAGWLPESTWCYQINTDGPGLTWHEANENCQQQGASLASFHGNLDFDHIVIKVRETGSNFWIGINNLDTNAGYKWSDKSVVNFVRWAPGQPRQNQSTALCGEVLAQDGALGLQVCSQLRHWVCGVPQGSPVHNITNDYIPQPEYSASACGSSETSWVKFQDSCYYISLGDGGTDNAMTWRESREWCLSHGAELASITSANESAFLRGMVNHGVPVDAVWIGLNELDRTNGYSWSDGTPVGTWQLNWNINEPDDLNGFEGCVEMLARNGKWNDQHCSVRQGFICKQPAVGSNVSTPAAIVRKGGHCPAGFSQLGYKCYKVMGLNGDLDRHSWADANLACRYMMANVYSNYSIYLASITSRLENAFVTTLLKEYNQSAWLGLVRRGSGQFTWLDNEDLGFENWNRNEPNLAAENDSCVYIDVSPATAGRWNDESCEGRMAYICQGFVDPAFPPVTPPPSALCNNTDGYQLMGSSCYKVVNASISWTQARQKCLDDHANLVSIMDGFDWAEVFLLAHDFTSGVWIGLNDQKTPGTYVWDSGYPVNFTRWAHHEPRGRGNCVYLDGQGLFNTSPCTELAAYVCRQDPDPLPLVPTPAPGGVCPSQDFSLIGSTCYLQVLDPVLTFDLAGRFCAEMETTLASFHGPLSTLNITGSEAVWIGLRELTSEGFIWTDFSAVDYVAWAPNKPSWSGQLTVEGSCVGMSPDRSWVNLDCEDQRSFLCSVAATPLDAYLTLPPINKTLPTTRAPRLSTKAAPTATPQTPALPSQASSSTFTPVFTTRISSSTSIATRSSTGSTRSSSSYSAHTTKSVSSTTRLYSSSNRSPSSSSTGTSAAVRTRTRSHTTARPPEGQQDSGGLDTGQIVGIVVGVLSAILLSILVLLFRRRWGSHHRSFLKREASRVKNFENSLYEETRRDTLTKPGRHLEGINIVALESDPRELSVSYSVPRENQLEVSYQTRGSFSIGPTDFISLDHDYIGELGTDDSNVIST